MKLFDLLKRWVGLGPGKLGPVYKSTDVTTGPQFGDLVVSNNLAPAAIVANAHAAFPVFMRAEAITEIDARSYKTAAPHFAGLADELVISMNFAAKQVKGERVYRRVAGRGLTTEEWNERSLIIVEKAATARGAKARGAAAVASTLSGAPVALDPEAAKELLEAGKEMRDRHNGLMRVRTPVMIAPHDLEARRELVRKNRARGATDFDLGLTEEQVLDEAFRASCSIPALHPTKFE